MRNILGHFTHADEGLPPQWSSENATADLELGRRSILSGPMTHCVGPVALALRGRPTMVGEFYQPATIASRILSLYREEGSRLLRRLHGSFALVIVDGEKKSVLLAIDRMGIEALAWGTTHDVVAFGTAAAEVARSLSGSPDLNYQALFDFMLCHVVAAPDSAYRGVQKLLAGHCVLLQGGRAESHRYWQPDFRQRSSPVAALQSEMLPTLARAIDAAGLDDRTGAFLSGGLDSSTVTGLLTQRCGPKVKAFSVGFGVDEFNELGYARAAVDSFGCSHEEYEVTSNDVIELLPQISAAYDEPFGNSSALPTFCCARLAKRHGVDHLLAGDGGDELFGGNERYVRQGVFELYGRLPTWLRKSFAEPVAARVDPERSPWPLRKLSSYVRQAVVPLPDRFQSWNLVYREGAVNIFDADFLASIDVRHASQRMREVWLSCPSSDLLDRMLWYDWKFTLADNDLRKVSRMCEIAGVRVSYPMLDESFVELSVQVPSEAKIRGTALRSFYKEAVREFLPRAIINKRKHGFGLPFGIWLKSNKDLQALVYASLSALESSRIIDRRFLRRIVDEHKDGHASYYGYVIWDMVMLEHWLRAQSRREATR